MSIGTPRHFAIAAIGLLGGGSIFGAVYAEKFGWIDTEPASIVITREIRDRGCEVFTQAYETELRELAKEQARKVLDGETSRDRSTWAGWETETELAYQNFKRLPPLTDIRNGKNFWCRDVWLGQEIPWTETRAEYLKLKD